MILEPVTYLEQNFPKIKQDPSSIAVFFTLQQLFKYVNSKAMLAFRIGIPIVCSYLTSHLPVVLSWSLRIILHPSLEKKSSCGKCDLSFEDTNASQHLKYAGTS